MAEQTIKAIRTQAGDLRIDYTALANAPTTDATLSQSGSFADAKAVGDKINNINNNLNNNFVSKTTTINGKPLTGNITLTSADLGTSATGHEHDASNITSGTLAIERGGTGAGNGKDGLKNLLAAGHMILSDYQYGTSVPPVPETSAERAAMMGRIFFVKV